MRLNWQLQAGYLNKKTCDDIVEFCKGTCIMQEAETYNKDSKARKTKVGWTTDQNLSQMIEKHALAANRSAFNFDVNFVPPIQFGEYGEGGHYDWHHDVFWENPGMYDRKLSVVIQLSDPQTYTGGDFQFQEVETPVAFRQQGSILVFPSYLLHRVTPVHSGVRHSLVAWLEGPRWR